MEPRGKDLTLRLTIDSDRTIGGGTASEGRGGGDCGCLVGIFCSTLGEGEARPLDERAYIPFLYWPTCTAFLTLLALSLRRMVGSDGSFLCEG